MIAVPSASEFSDYNVGWLEIGEVYDLHSHLASLLLVAGCAEVVPVPFATAAEVSRRRIRPKKKTR